MPNNSLNPFAFIGLYMGLLVYFILPYKLAKATGSFLIIFLSIYILVNILKIEILVLLK
jgi:hypothetical protein